MAEDFQTPMLQQYAKIKERYPDALLFFRLGDFYELFFDDAKIGSTVMNITLTKRSRGADGDVPMCGVPFHAADNYISKLVTAGYKVAIAEQLTDPKETKGLVEREVIRVITPGTVVSEKILEKKENNFLLCVDIKKQNLGLSFADVGTGGFWVYETSFTSLEKDLGVILKQLQPRELLLPPLLYENAAILKMIKLEEGINVYRLGSFDAWSKNAVQTLTEHFGIKSLSAFGVENAEYPLALPAAAALLTYLKDTQKNNLPHITKLTPYSTKSYLRLDSATMTNLEIFKTVRSQGKRGSLINLIDKTMTAMGGRLLRSWLRQPLTDLQTIEDRQAAVNTLLQNTSGRQVLIERLGEIVDIERLISRLSLGVGTPRDLDSLRLCLQESGKIASFLASDLPSIKDKLSQNLTTILDPLAQYLSATIIENPPLSTKEGGFIQKGVSTELDSLRELLSGDTKWLSELQVRERQKTGIENLKINSNKVYGYYIEVSKSNLASVPDYYIRKQTLVNAERFIIPELKERENQVFEAEDRINKLELQLF